MTLPRNLWEPHIALLASISDVERPVTVAEVVDLSRYTTTGAGFVGVMHGGALRWAAYRDGPAPALGGLVQIKRGDAPLDAPWYAWPLPYALPTLCPGSDFTFLTTAQPVAGGAWRVLHCRVADGVATWTDRAACPGSGDYRPLWAHYDGTDNTTRYFTYSPGDALYYSDDEGSTWATASGTAGIAYISTAAIGANSGLNYGGAVTPSACIETTDRGSSWSVVPNSAPPSGSWRFGGATYYSPSDDAEPTGFVPLADWAPDHSFWWTATDTGLYFSANKFRHYFYPDEAPIQPFTDPNRGWTDPGSDIGAVATGVPTIPTPPGGDPPLGAHVVSETRPHLYGYQPLSLTGGRHAFQVPNSASGAVLLQPGDSTTTSDPGMEPSGRGFYTANRAGFLNDWATSPGIHSGTAPGLQAVHQAQGGETELQPGGVLVADRDDGEGYALRNWGFRFGGQNWVYLYLGSTNHPTGKAGIGTRAAGFTLDCIVVALDEADAGDSTYCLHPYTVTSHDYTGSQSDPASTVDGPYADISAAQVAQLGAKYRASYGGIASIDVPYVPPPTLATTSAVGGAKAQTTAPSGWETPGYDDSAWLPTVAGSGFSGIDGAALVQADAASSPTAYFRQTFTLAADVAWAMLHLAANNAGISDIYVNGVPFYHGAPNFTTYDIPITSAIIPGATNLIAFGASAAVLGGTFTAVAYSVEAGV